MNILIYFFEGLYKSGNRTDRQEKLEELHVKIQELTSRQVVLIKKRRELESAKQPVLIIYYMCHVEQMKAELISY